MGKTNVKVAKPKSGLTFFQKVKRSRILLLMCLPEILFFIAFSYAPLPGIWVAFVKYNYRNGIFGSKFVGLQNFEFLAQSGKLLTLTRNTILYNLAFIILGNVIAVFIAILLNEIQSKWFKKVSQTMMFLPYFISQVLVGVLVYNLLNYDFGFAKALVAESLTESVLPLLDEQCDVEILPDGTRFIKDDAVLDGLFLRRNGKKAYVLGDVSVEDKESLEAMEYIHVHGELELPEKWADILADKPEITYDSLQLQKERSGKMLRVEDKLKAMLTRQMLEEYPGGVILEDCAKIEVAEDVPAEWITVERVVIRDCAKVCGSAEQLPNLYLVCEDVAKITDGQADQEDEDGKDVSVINAASYTL